MGSGNNNSNPSSSNSINSNTGSSSATIDNGFLSDFSVSQLTVTMYIPTSNVGAVIGRRGATIANIQKQAQTPNAPPVRVSVVGHHHQGSETGTPLGSSPPTATTAMGGASTLSAMSTQPATTNLLDANSSAAASAAAGSNGSVPFTYTPLDFTDPTWTPVVIRADPLAALVVAQKLETLCSSLQDSILDIPIGRQKHATLVGKKGLTLMQTSADTHCRIWVPPKELKLDVIQLEGSLSECHACLKAFYHLLSGTSNSATANNSNNTVNPLLTSSTAAPVVTLIEGAGSNPNHTYTHQSLLVVSSLPSQTKLRSVGRKTDTLIKKKKITAQMAAVAVAAVAEATAAKEETSTEEASPEKEAAQEQEPASPKQAPAESAPTATLEESSNPDIEAIAPPLKDAASLVGSWQLTIMGASEAQVINAYTILAKWAENNAGNNDGASGNPPSTPTGKGNSNNSGTPSPGSRVKGGRNSGGGRGGGKGRKGKGRGGGNKESTPTGNNTGSGGVPSPAPANAGA